MYLNTLAAEQVGPFEKLAIELPFDEAGRPKPIVLVGKNGAGKTTVLAHVVDALHEFGADHYRDLLPQQGLGRAFFKVCGVTNQRTGSPFGFFFLEFKHADNVLQYLDKSGTLTLEQCQKQLGRVLKVGGWEDGENQKLSTDSKLFVELFRNDIYVFFPAHRFEHPNWLNSEDPQVRDQFALRPRVADRLDKPIMVAHSAERNRAWLLDIVLDHEIYKDETVFNAANAILRGVLDRQDVRFGVGPRVGSSRTAICSLKGDILIPTVSHLSGGQASLLNLFLTLLRYGDKGQATKLEDLTGIVLIDEIEGHLHTRLQNELLPSLIKQFPRIQFIITSHAPVFLLGMERTLGADGFVIQELPRDKRISARDFSEYRSIVEGLDLAEALKKVETNFVVFVEGETDKVILEQAWQKLFPGRSAPFAVVNAFDCNLIRNTLKRDDVFNESPSKTFIGLLDFDDAYDVWNSTVSGGNQKWTVDSSATEENGLLAAHPIQKGFVALLPVPAFRAQFAAKRFGGKSCVSIEFLFPDAYLANYVRMHDLPGGGNTLEFKANKKTEFAAKTTQFPVEAFDAFKPVFALLDDIITGKRPVRIAQSNPPANDRDISPSAIVSVSR